jgi:hypothetical protein
MQKTTVSIKPANNRYNFAYIFKGKHTFVEYEPKRYIKVLTRVKNLITKEVNT